MSAIIALLIVLGAGLFIGSRLQSAREAHALFSSYRARAALGLGSWLRHTAVVTLSVIGLLVLLYLIVFALHIR